MKELIEQREEKFSKMFIELQSIKYVGRKETMLDDVVKFNRETTNLIIDKAISLLETNPNLDGSESPNIHHWIEAKQTELRKLKI